MKHLEKNFKYQRRDIFNTVQGSVQSQTSSDGYKALGPAVEAAFDDEELNMLAIKNAFELIVKLKP